MNNNPDNNSPKSVQNTNYIAMAIFVVVGFLNLYQKEFSMAAVYIALGVAIGGSNSKPWNELSMITKVIVVSLTIFATVLIGYTIVTDFITK